MSGSSYRSLVSIDWCVKPLEPVSDVSRTKCSRLSTGKYGMGVEHYLMRLTMDHRITGFAMDGDADDIDVLILIICYTMNINYTFKSDHTLADFLILCCDFPDNSVVIIMVLGMGY